MADMTEKQMAARALGYLEGISIWLWEHASDTDDVYCDHYDRALEILRKAIDWGDGA